MESEMEEARLDFRILGPLGVLVDGRDVTPARPKQRALLALLVLRANEILSSDELIDALWGDRPPATAQAALRGHVSSLRKIFGQDTIATRPPGYVLRVGPEQTDLERFQRLLDEAGRESAPSERARLLRSALALFRGDPLADSRWPEAARAYLNGDFLTAADTVAAAGAKPEEAEARARAAEVLAREGRRPEAEAQLEAALAFYRSVGATRYLQELPALDAPGSEPLR
jgi:DNA-binding SARP family transcriptional activator